MPYVRCNTQMESALSKAKAAVQKEQCCDKGKKTRTVVAADLVASK
jgi:hypothetical protein